MRIIGGWLGGRTFDAPRGHRTHPMSDKIRGALFNMLGDVKGLTVLDAFAGSGALSLEAVSRGAKHATAIELEKVAYKAVEKNVSSLALEDRIKPIKASCRGWSNRHPDTTFDLVLCDPPYDDLQLPTLQKLVRHVAPEGVYVLSWPGNIRPIELQQLKMVEQKSYGDAQLLFYKRL